MNVASRWKDHLLPHELTTLGMTQDWKNITGATVELEKKPHA